jgi:hypothetical protein
MARKSIKDAASMGANSEFQRALDRHAQEAAKDAQDAQGDEYVRMTLRVPTDVKEWLYEAAFSESTPTRRVAATAYLVELVRADRDRHKGK